MAKMGMNVDTEPKPKVVVEKEKKRKETEKPKQALLDVVRPQIIRKEYPVDEDEEIDILGEEGNDSPVDTNMTESEPKIKIEPENPPIPALVITASAPTTIAHDIKPIMNKITTKEHDANIPLSPITKTGNEDRETSPNSNQNAPLTETPSTTSHTNETQQPHHCTKCNHICNNCSSNINNTLNNNNNNINNNNNNETHEYEDCDEEGGFESHIDCPTPTEEKVFEVDTVSPEEMSGNREFFCGNSAKTPERYLKIRNTIVEQWLKHKPKYLSKTSVRTSLKDCGDVNAIGRVHEFLELTGAINFGADRPPRHRHPPATHLSRLSTAPHQSLSPLQLICTHHTCPHNHPTTTSTTTTTTTTTEVSDEVLGPRKRRVRNRTSEWTYEDEQPTTFEHKPSEDGREYEQRFAALNAKYFVEEDDAKKKPRNKRTKHTNQDSEENLPYDPFRLIPCSRTLSPVVSTPTPNPNSNSTPSSSSTASSSSPSPSPSSSATPTNLSFTLSVQSTALVIMDAHAHMATTEVLGLLGGTYDAGARHLHIALAVPCESTSSKVQCEMDPQSQVVAREGLAARGLLVVGWYHSHPAFAPCPSIRDIETQALYQKVCTSPFVGIIVSPYDPQHPSDVSLFNYIVVGDEWSVNHEYQIPYEVPRTIVSDLPTPALFNQIAEIIQKYRTYKYRVDMNKMFRRGERTTCLEKMLRSITGHYFVSQGVSGDEQALLVSKIRNLFQKIEKAEKAEKAAEKEKLGKVTTVEHSEQPATIHEKSEGEKSEKGDNSQVDKTEATDKAKSTSTGKRKKDLMQLHQQQQQQRILQQQQTQHQTQPAQQQQQQQQIQQSITTEGLQLNSQPAQSNANAQIPHAQVPQTQTAQATTQATQATTQATQATTQSVRAQPPSPQTADLSQTDQKHLHPQVPIKIQQKQQRHQQTTSNPPPSTLTFTPQLNQLTSNNQQTTTSQNSDNNTQTNQQNQLVNETETKLVATLSSELPPLQPIHQTPTS